MSSVQFVTDDKGKKTGVFLTMKQYQKLMLELEELEEIKAYDRAKKNAGQKRTFESFIKELETP
ncbi:hypothetical protein [Runella sp.]|uniref:hypothetical protein n=1 Tax=Runella sp. TaxID=1960881 RepID=UPI003D10E4A9